MGIAGRLVQLIRAVGVEGKVVLTGGLSRDAGMIAAIQQTLDADKGKKTRKAIAEIAIETFPDAIYAGAIGAALLGALRFDQLKQRTVRGELHG
jgi:benzoyl-CoA reductase subunit D